MMAFAWTPREAARCARHRGGVCRRRRTRRAAFRHLAALTSGDALPQAVVDACDAGWAKIKASGVCPSYERGTSLYKY